MTQLILPVRSASGRGPDGVALRVTTDRLRRWLALGEELTRRGLYSVRLFAEPVTLDRQTCAVTIPAQEPLLTSDDVRTCGGGTAHHAGIVIRQTGVHVHASIDEDGSTDDAYRSLQLSPDTLRSLITQLESREDGTDDIAAFDEVELTEDLTAHGHLLIPRGAVCTVRAVHHAGQFGVSVPGSPDAPVFIMDRRGFALLLQDDERPNFVDEDDA
ncbi:hypothetical protein [Deinococcus soli (ex Cha et al. 2016)]|uniref:Uncharacterized protein n=2 Tax=Deinococcus soli (ex Cha et al. 2016) TaxID=1309411 RepID=A0AAE3XB47_9DEIO|nr:hypothetical protein [Deinococcus soli (ex Cha et al. 2016)]MDR6218217.1 hypothetical protein [Deinococcus soli (ex Cha et al. 2016)]MDR6328957.1 hypothetical protein [Deinococcus soli (ex Cha et al. 2016)]MDR6751230.1 hypothetical protein [Deinococcus soli (ex Cha et al. 2016)]